MKRARPETGTAEWKLRQRIRAAILWSVGVVAGTTNALSADFANCLGYFQYADYRFYQFADFPVVARVYEDGGRYFVQDIGQAPVELIPVRSDEVAARFTTTVNQKEYVFVMGHDGQARELVTIRQGHVQDQAPRAQPADWEAAAAKLHARMGSRLPSPGTEALLRKQISAWATGQLDGFPLPYRLAGAQMEPEKVDHFRQVLAELGEFVALSFVRVNQTGWDVFHLEFADGSLEVAAAPLSPSGKFAGENYRRL
jgi:hypothetical protein